MIIYESTPTAPTITAGAYAAGDAVGGVMSILTGGIAGDIANSTVLQDAQLIDRAQQNAIIKLVLFSSSPTAIADNAAFDVITADDAKVITVITFDTYTDVGSRTISEVKNITKAVSSNTTIYGQMYTTGTPTYTATSDLRLKLWFCEY